MLLIKGEGSTAEATDLHFEKSAVNIFHLSSHIFGVIPLSLNAAPFLQISTGYMQKLLACPV